MNIDELRALITLADQGQLSLFELRRPDFRLRLEGASQAVPASLPHDEPMVTPGAVVHAPGFGFFCTHHPSRAAALCDDADLVQAGDVLALIRVDELYLPVVSDQAGAVRRLVDDGTLVGYGTPLFDIAA